MSGSHLGRAARTVAALIFFFSSSLTLAAEEGSENAASKAAWHAAGEAMQRGPTTITLRDQGKINLPEGYGFVPPKEAAAVMDLMGNQTDGNFLGMIFPTKDDAGDWFVTIDFDPAGYIKDDDAKDWDADELLGNLKEGTEAGNAHRHDLGIAPIEVTRWVEKPAYEQPTHRLVWSAEIRDKGSTDPDTGVNYNTYVLGRDGYISLNLVTSTAQVEAQKPAARELLAAVSFNDGKRYSDFNSSTDKVAAYGLAALVGGIAVKKLGLLAVAGAFFLKFAKLIIVGVAAAGGGIAKFFKGRSANSST
jgi:uncharacterized membrane-anchored protein